MTNNSTKNKPTRALPAMHPGELQREYDHETARGEDAAAIRTSLVEGERSGEPQPFDGRRFKREMLKKHGA